MILFETRKEKRIRRLRTAAPFVFLLAVCICFVLAVNMTTRDSLTSQKEALENALRGGAVRTYALTGCYPESLDEILKDYHITFDREKFLVDYIPNGSNLFPSIFVMIRSSTKEAR